MLFYIIWLILSVVITFLVNAVYAYYTKEFSILYAFIGSIGNFTIIFILDVIISTIIHKLPEKWFHPELKIYRSFKWEKRFYEKVGVKKWKDKVPDMGQLCNFKKGKVESDDPKYLYKFLVEMNYAEVIHIGMALVGFFDLLIWPWAYLTNFILPMIFTNILLNVPPIIIQRYNRPKLLNYYQYKTRNKEK